MPSVLGPTRRYPMPQSALALLPLHAAWREDFGQARATFLDDHCVTYTPSLHTTGVSQRRLLESGRGNRRALCVVNPNEDLPYAEAEGAAVIGYFDQLQAVTLVRSHATEATVVAAVPDAGYLHFATHGLYDWRDVTRSLLRSR
jgi:CHAT domain-containing protein